MSPADLVGSGRDAEAAEQLRGAVALRPFDAEAYRLLGGLLGERWERRALRTRSTDFGVRESDVPESELRAEAVDVEAVARHLRAIEVDPADMRLRAGARDRLVAVLRTPQGVIEIG